MTERSKNLNTTLGVLAVAFWSASFGVVRSLTEQVGTYTAAAAVYLLAGVIGCGYMAATPGAQAASERVPLRRRAVRGGLFATYVVCIYTAMGLAHSRQQAIEASLINYLWPGLTLLLSVPILGNRPRPSLLLGLIMAFGGAVLATAQVGTLSAALFVEHLRADWVPYAFALVASCTWALYSNLSRLWESGARRSAVPGFVLATGIVLAVLAVLYPGHLGWTGRAVAEWVCLAVFPVLLGYLLWDVAMRRGRIVVLAALSQLAPLLSAVIASLYLGVPLGPRLWLAAALIVAGAAICRLSVAESERPGAAGQ
jgi:drug/metabolite transporter (DMT)-like permease